MSLRDFPTAKKRREYLEKKLGLNLSSLLSDEIEENGNVFCENLIGSTKIPVGVAGPLIYKENSKTKEVYFPLATTEGALVASVNRGCKAISKSGGAYLTSYLHGQTRGPVFKTNSVENGNRLKNWIDKNKNILEKRASITSSHIKYLGAKIKIIGSFTFVRFSFDTSEAMGMNMVTIATESMVDLIEEKLKIKCVSVAGNFDNDKKASWLNTIEGRGYEAWADCVIKKEVLKEILHSNASDIYNVWLSKCMVGSYASGSLGFNAQFANIIASLFIATGQDAAHVVEGSCGITTCEVRGDDLYISVNLPSLNVGIIGGGTVLPTQRSGLDIMGIVKKSKSSDLAKKIAGCVLAGELSLLSSLSSGTLGKAHKNLGRKSK